MQYNCILGQYPVWYTCDVTLVIASYFYNWTQFANSFTTMSCVMIGFQHKLMLYYIQSTVCNHSIVEEESDSSSRAGRMMAHNYKGKEAFMQASC